MNSSQKIVQSMMDLIGDIPLVRLNRIGKTLGSDILVKPEFLNPSGSIKDRIAKLMVEDAEERGLLHEGSTIIEATTGNTGTALSFVAAVKGYKMKAYSPAMVANRSRMAIMQAYGCEVESVNIDSYEASRSSDSKNSPADTSVHGGHVELLPRQVCLDLEKGNPNLWWARQFSNPCNVSAHRDGTAREILEKTDGQLDAFVASVGTGGTILGVAQALKLHNPNILIVGVEPSGKAMMGNPEDYPLIPGISDGIIPQIFESHLIDRVISITDQEAIDMAHQLAQLEGIFCGMSSGANVLASVRVAQDLGPGKRIVTVLPDSRDRYLEVEKYTT
ncbi:MAG: cysteine synthase family protein [Anaerolineaceae bacterium]|nr:cysteine synthase family protein [Anaerolineaceae bacterium]